MFLLTGHNLSTDKDALCSRCIPIEMRRNLFLTAPETVKASEDRRRKLNSMTAKALRGVARDAGVTAGNLTKSKLVEAIVHEEIGSALDSETMDRYRQQLLSGRTTDLPEQYLTYRTQFNAPDVFNRYVNEVKLPACRGEAGNFIKAMLAIGVVCARTLYCGVHGYIKLRDFVQMLAHELLSPP